ncbi:SpoIIE family protein phosphatase [Eudoraea adriatica]|uniref:SpoIIE family protein phosphatase n=1 Tax=Eudoraea adriatica TaxID=446681 RepID=UPI00036456B4|nr:transporter substrate-binding domain-containing protein [Eudoraea adriatica]
MINTIFNIISSVNYRFFILLLLLVLFPVNTFSQTSSLQFTEEEKSWIEANPEINVGNDQYWPPMDFYSEGQAMGYSIDLMNLIAKEIGIKINYVSGLSWSELLEALKSGEITVLPAISKTDERETYIRFSEPYIKLPYVKVIHSSSDNDTISSLEGKNIAVFKGTNIENALASNVPNANLVYINSIEEALQNVSTGEVDVLIEDLAVINYYLGQSYFPNITLNSDDLEFLGSSEVFIGVLKENRVLGDLIDKGFDAVPKEELDRIRAKWLGTIEYPTEKDDSISSYELLEILIYSLLGLIILTLVIRFGLKKFSNEKISLEFGSRRFRILSVLGMFIIVLIISLIGWWALDYNKKRILSNLEISLETTLSNTHERLNSWADQYRILIEQLGRDPDLLSETEKILKLQNDDILSSQALAELKSFYDKQSGKLQSVGFYIIDKKFNNVASSRNSDIGIENLIYIQKPNLINKVFNGNTVFIPPIKSDVVLDSTKVGNSSSKPPTMFFVTPIKNNSEEVLAALAIRIDPAAGFSRVLQLSRIGKTGECYAFDISGRLLSESRFDDDLRKIGLIPKDGEGILNIEIRDPGGNMVTGYQSNIPRDQQPLTHMAKSATKGGSETNMSGYRDYRGVSVYGAWLWDEKLGLGITVEIDVEEGLSTYNTMFYTISGVIGIALLLMIFAILFTLNLGESANKALVKAKDQLEDKVDERTKELSTANKQTQAIVDSLADALIIINELGIIVSFSPSAEKMFQYKKEEIIGRNIQDLMPSPHKEAHDGYLENYKRTGIRKIIGFEREVNGLRKDGSMFPASLKVSEVLTEKNSLYVGLMSDLTDQKKSELRLKSQSAALKSAANGVVITNITGEIVWVNPAFSELTGYSWRELVGKTPRIINSGKQDKSFFKNMWDTIMAGDTWQGEIINKKKNGSLFYEEMTITPIINDKGEIDQFVAIKNDISERKKMEEILIKANERMSGELNIAKEIQMSMLPLIFPAFPKRSEIDIYANLIPAREVGGDFYDFQFLDDNHIYFVVGDVSGKGVPAALMMAVTKTLLKSTAGNDKSTASILTHVNNEIAKDNDAYMFITIFIAILNTSTGEMVYSNAGHNPSFIVKSDKEIIKLGELHGPVVGAMEDMTYTETKVTIDKNDMVFAYTDGVTEAQNLKEELYSDPRLIDLLKNGEYKDPTTLINLVEDSVFEFQGKAEQFDDITALSLQYLGDKEYVMKNSFSATIKNQLNQMPQVIEAFEVFGEKNELSFGIIQKFNIALDELLNNIISYGFQDDSEHEILVDVELRNERLIITFTDDGVPFNPFRNDPPDTKLSIDERNIGGLGIHIVKNLVDEYAYRRHADKNIITLVKYNINK